LKTNFKITKIPVGALKEFKKFCKEECGDVYAVGIIQLLKIKKQWESFAPLLARVLNEIAELKTQTKSEVKTFNGS